MRVEGGSGEGGDVGRVVNGKTKTTNCKHMWTHPFTRSPSHPLTLTFTLPPHIGTENPLRALSKMYVWNYNRNIHVSVCVCACIYIYIIFLYRTTAE